MNTTTNKRQYNKLNRLTPEEIHERNTSDTIILKHSLQDHKIICKNIIYY